MKFMGTFCISCSEISIYMHLFNKRFRRSMDFSEKSDMLIWSADWMRKGSKPTILLPRLCHLCRRWTWTHVFSSLIVRYEWIENPKVTRSASGKHSLLSYRYILDSIMRYLACPGGVCSWLKTKLEFFFWFLINSLWTGLEADVKFNLLLDWELVLHLVGGILLDWEKKCLCSQVQTLKMTLY